MDKLQIPVAIERMEHQSKSSAVPLVRTVIGTSYFPEGTCANSVCLHITDKMAGMDAKGRGIWVLQVRVPPEERHLYKDLEDGMYATVRDSKHGLREGQKYVALNYTGGPDIIIL
ncbi:hypothetical protein CAPTEDRAFT_214273 [Capitella teleta]|uniref:Uncharacterized protein n=1 Tax=Capitella teleta TaxID=283909 RepID=R7VIY1_CAPTE|nr:hypothetical protein CAPTEDRAFT_214273 [Capitella teleta]|eukprot:ELU18589.1 hypothetical protein CAPTEDRAFT_214273 [Capitella teleta]